jgi:hypothetical protein
MAAGWKADTPHDASAADRWWLESTTGQPGRRDAKDLGGIAGVATGPSSDIVC